MLFVFPFSPLVSVVCACFAASIIIRSGNVNKINAKANNLQSGKLNALRVKRSESILTGFDV